MRSSRVITLVACAALVAACSDSGGPSDNNTAPAADFTFACSDLTCTFTDHSSDTDGSIASQSWNFGDNTAAGTGAAPQHTYAAAGTYSVTVAATDNDGASTTSTARSVTVTAGGAGVQAVFSVLCTSLDCAITNTSTPSGAGETYAWDFGDGTQTSTDRDPAPVHYNVSAITTFTITLVVTNAGVSSQATQQVTVSPAATLTCAGVDCTLPVPAGATVRVTLVSHDCQVHGNTFVITAPVVDTLFTDGCFAAVDPAAGSSFDLNNGQAFTQATDLAAEVLTGVAGSTSAQLNVTGSFAAGWTLSFDDGFVGPGEPDFNDLIITVKATLP